jgi:hypothetical protein
MWPYGFMYAPACSNHSFLQEPLSPRLCRFLKAQHNPCSPASLLLPVVRLLLLRRLLLLLRLLLPNVSRCQPSSGEPEVIMNLQCM